MYQYLFLLLVLDYRYYVVLVLHVQVYKVIWRYVHWVCSGTVPYAGIGNNEIDMRQNMHISVVCIVEIFLNMHISEICVVIPMSDMHIKEICIFKQSQNMIQNMHRHGVSSCWLSKIHMLQSSEKFKNIETSGQSWINFDQATPLREKSIELCASKIVLSVMIGIGTMFMQEAHQRQL